MTPLKTSFNKDHHLIGQFKSNTELQSEGIKLIESKIIDNVERLRIVRNNLERAKRIYEQEVTKRRKGPTPLHKIGDKILIKGLRKAALTNPWLGPYIITDINHETNTVLQE